MSRLLFACLLLLTARGLQAASPTTHEFSDHFKTALTERGIPGGAWAVIEDGKLLASGGVGVRGIEDANPVTADTVFRIASISKTFAAQLTALLVRDGKLHWEDKVGRAVPDLAFKQAQHGAQLQLQHLLSHSTGIVSNAYDNLLEANQPLDRILPQFRSLKPLCAPGRCYTYQNVLFALSAPVIEKATGESYAEQIRQRLIIPLKMQNTSVGMKAFLASPDRAHPHLQRAGRWLPGQVQAGYYQVEPAAGINASANDLARWLTAQLGDSPDIIPPETVSELTQPRVRTTRDLQRRAWRDLLTDAHYGLGWRIYQIGDETIYLHAGWVHGYVAEISYSRQHRAGLVMLLNGESGLLADLGAKYWSARLRNTEQPQG
ncbi:serine hydrolase domain-containing protein [Pseudomarimonas arenosa]|uniref:Beta-lactamase family protein n=1 Tax=Pseudomarimonas arenosa TaxID=2774145 RepID=A0AAW3ZKW4_9GAMM|nr:serine hydrolase domain-containing protein [Pseudomarimonas arenosa]MBD8526085.1 beta-lactamase family protein [Pseudomarimonas arenosa]